MKRFLKISVITLALFSVAAWASVTMRDLIITASTFTNGVITNSTINSTSVGATTPSTGVFTGITLTTPPTNCGSVTPSYGIDAHGNALCLSTTWQDAYGSVAGCSFPNDGGGLNCVPGSITWSPAFPGTSYSVACEVMYSAAIAGGSSTQPVLIVNATNTSGSSTTITEGVAQGSSGGYGVSTSYGATIQCHAHSN